MIVLDKDSLSHMINQHCDLFGSFCNVYLFGSSLEIEKTPDDIDILLIYYEYSSKIINDLNMISSAFAKLSDLPVDFSALSVNEEKETMFLKRLNNKYLVIK